MRPRRIMYRGAKYVLAELSPERERAIIKGAQAAQEACEEEKQLEHESRQSHTSDEAKELWHLANEKYDIARYEIYLLFGYSERGYYVTSDESALWDKHCPCLPLRDADVTWKDDHED